MYRNRSSGATREVPIAEIIAKTNACVENIHKKRQAEIERHIGLLVNRENNTFLRRHGLRKLIDRSTAHAMLKKPHIGGSAENYILESYGSDMRQLEELLILCASFDNHDVIAVDTDTALVLNKWAKS